MQIHIERLGDGPIIRPCMDARMGANVNGPSLIEAPDWLPGRLGRYYLYFAHHDGAYIRLAYADYLQGPWRTYAPGVLPLAESGFAGHIASPDVHVDHAERRIRMYFHGADAPTGHVAPQTTRIALSPDGLAFTAESEDLGAPYMRVVRHGGWYYALAMPGLIYRSRDGIGGFEPGPPVLEADTRHMALLLRGDRLLVFFTRVGDVPERILLCALDLSRPWGTWKASEARVVLEPEREFEGATLPLRPSVRGIADDPVRELRDPAVFHDESGLYLLYAVAGESGIAIARLTFDAEAA